ncbi:hypothetical protein [Arthrobacter sp. RIT-PI-e]|uniref:hypothetical protein n=1 Tax=Arthrobacter sp. RIT-PI-e TaxID=1681197 RepID=UPI00128F0369|nr:hypothetical protein [Arthrobacter sp. RIT-PI-e]
MEVAGTTTFAKPAVVALVDRYQLPERGYFEAGAWLQREPENPVDVDAVAVIVEGEKVGNLPSYRARALQLPPQASTEVRYQLHVLQGEKWAAKAFIWLGPGAPQWTYSADSPPALTSRQRTLAAAKQQSEMVREALEGGGDRARQFQRGMYQGVHYLQLVEPIKQLKREDRLEEALALCYQAIKGAEQDRGGREPAPWYTEQAAIVHRKLGQHQEEITVLERWLSMTPPDRRGGSTIAERHRKCVEKKGLPKADHGT